MDIEKEKYINSFKKMLITDFYWKVKDAVFFDDQLIIKEGFENSLTSLELYNRLYNTEVKNYGF